jgi:hypothetical protein
LLVNVAYFISIAEYTDIINILSVRTVCSAEIMPGTVRKMDGRWMDDGWDSLAVNGRLRKAG